MVLDNQEVKERRDIIKREALLWAHPVVAEATIGRRSVNIRDLLHPLLQAHPVGAEVETTIARSAGWSISVLIYLSGVPQ